MDALRKIIGSAMIGSSSPTLCIEIDNDLGVSGRGLRDAVLLISTHAVLALAALMMSHAVDTVWPSVAAWAFYFILFILLFMLILGLCIVIFESGTDGSSRLDSKLMFGGALSIAFFLIGLIAYEGVWEASSDLRSSTVLHISRWWPG